MDRSEVTYRPIGVVHSPFEKPEDVPKHAADAVDAIGTVEVAPEFEEGLALVDGFSHLQLITHLHLSGEPRMRCSPPFAPGVSPGIFATRGPRRPNPIGISVVRLLDVDSPSLTVKQVDLVDGTPLLDIRPFAPKPHEYEDVRGGWLEDHTAQTFSAPEAGGEH